MHSTVLALDCGRLFFCVTSFVYPRTARNLFGFSLLTWNVLRTVHLLLCCGGLAPELLCSLVGMKKVSPVESSPRCLRNGCYTSPQQGGRAITRISAAGGSSSSHVWSLRAPAHFFFLRGEGRKIVPACAQITGLLAPCHDRPQASTGNVSWTVIPHRASTCGGCGGLGG